MGRVMEVTPQLQKTILEASRQAKILFDANQWKWALIDRVPTLGEIVDSYTNLTKEVFLLEGIRTMAGHLTVDYDKEGGVLEFGIETAYYIES